MKETLAKSGVAAVTDGEKFEMIVPSDQVKAVNPHAPKAKAQMTGGPGSEGAPDVEMDFLGAPLVQVFDIYASMFGGQFDRAAPRPAAVQPSLWLHSRAKLSRAEGLYALDTLLGWRGIKMVRGADGLVRAVQEPAK